MTDAAGGPIADVSAREVAMLTDMAVRLAFAVG